MSALKMFFCVVSEARSVDFSVHRELNSIYSLWSNEKSIEKVGLIHIGFMRPKVPSFEEIEGYHGRILLSASGKWALPEEYKTSKKAVIQSNGLPFYQLLTGFGFNIDCTDQSENLRETATDEPSIASNSTHTIASAALEVLDHHAKPMSKEEIYGHIIERGLFHFGAKKPISVLSVELNRHCEGTDYSNASTIKVFGKTNTNLFFSLSCSPKDFESWLKELPETNSELIDACLNLNIFNDKTYFDNKHALSETQIRRLELIRYNTLKISINVEDPSKLLPILPISILEAHISQLGLTVRTSNVFFQQEIFTLKDALAFSLLDMMKWPNFGKKSAKDLCSILDSSVENLSFQLPINPEKPNLFNPTLDSEEIEAAPQIDSSIEHISEIPLKQHLENSLALLEEKERTILEYRIGYQGAVKTLEEVGAIIGVTRERIRQIQKKNVNKIILTQYWDDCIAIKIGVLLSERKIPLYLEMIETEDKWFAGFLGNYSHLAAIIELFSDNEIRLLKINGTIVISRITQDEWDSLVSNFRASLKVKAKEMIWTKSDIELTFKASLEEAGAVDLLPLIWDIFSEILKFDGEGPLSKLVAYGRTAEGAVLVALQKAEGPLHFSEMAVRASEILGKKVDARLAHNVLPRLGAKLYDRGIYGLPKFNPISDITCNHIRLVVNKTLYEGTLAKQWHVTEILSELKNKFPSLPNTLDLYVLNIILEASEKLTYLNKNVWARSDSNQSPVDRVGMADAFTKILEDSGRPLKGVEIKSILKEVRGVHQDLQLQPTERMILVGPDTWGLVERDVGGTTESNKHKLDAIFNYLSDSQIGIHVTEVSECLTSYQLDPNETSSYTLLNLAQRDERFFLGRAMFLGLSAWGEDVRRLNYSQAVRKILDNMHKPMSQVEIQAQVEILTGLDVDISVTGLLINEGGIYDVTSKLWRKG